MILALDTTSEFGSLALVDGTRAIAELPMYSSEGFGHVLFGQIESFMNQQGIGLPDIACFAAAAGPGSFTGVRVGLAAIKGLAVATGRLAVGVSNLQAAAYYGTATLRAVVMDARRGEVYGALYDSNLKLIGAETVSAFATWLRDLPSGQLEFVSNDFSPFEQMADPSIPVVRAPRSLALAVGCIAARDLGAGQAVDPALIDANYVRRSDAELLWRDNRLS